MVGGYGSGKTYIGALRMLYLSYMNQGLPNMYVSPSYKFAKRTIVITLKDIMNRSGIDYIHNKSDNAIQIKNWDGLIWFGSGDDPDSLRGSNLASAGIDEPFIQKKEVFQQMVARVRHPDSSQPEIFLTGTPEELNWGYELAMNGGDRWDVGTVFGSTLDNTHLPDEYKDSLTRGYSDEMIDAYVKGKFVNLKQGRVYKPFDREIHCIDRPLSDFVNIPVHIGMDFNVDYMSAEIFAHIGNTIHVYDEVRLTNSNTFEMADILEKKYPRAFIYPDPSGSARRTSSSRSDHEILRQRGFIIKSKRKQPPVRTRVNEVNNLIRTNRLTMQNCPYLIADMERVVWKRGDIDKTSHPELTHSSDGLGYAIDYLEPIKKPITQTYRG